MKMPLHSIFNRPLNSVLLLLLFALLLTQCSKPLLPRLIPKAWLFVLADDLGIDAMPGYALGAQKPTLPTLEGLANNGLRFTQAWANPVCSPTRASILTGKYGFRTGVLGVEQNNNINPNERILQRAFNEQIMGPTALASLGNGTSLVETILTCPKRWGSTTMRGCLAEG